MDNPKCETCGEPNRRGFFKRVMATILGAIVTIFPFAAGLALWLDPARRKSNAAGEFVCIATLTAVPEDGVPRKFPVLASRVDAWNKSPETAVGAVYLRRTPGEKPRAFNVVCPHAGCFVDYLAARDTYLCPCHNSTFALDGKINDPKSPSPRGLDELEVEIRNKSEVWVKFQNFRAGVAEKIPA
jgi:menaquinol-cytochrome c reductase iron-sulfur subunit